jgi:steroid delta-isomerase-like uncharacterized protein
MEPVQIAQQYFEAFNGRDPGAIVATFAKGGTYVDPATPAPLTGDAIGAYAQGLWNAFPDLAFGIISVSQGEDGLVAAEWLMTGTNTGSFNGLPPTGKQVSLPGADFIRVEGDKIRSVQGYFNGGALPLALGLDVIVQPKAVGPFSFGTSIRAYGGNEATPGAFSITVIEGRSEEEKKAIADSGRQIVTEMLGMPEFVGWMGATIGDRMITVTAWETPDGPRQLLKGGEHRSAMSRFFGPEIGSGGVTSVWIPARINARWVRCPSCSKMADSDAAQGNCPCGSSLPEPLPYW